MNDEQTCSECRQDPVSTSNIFAASSTAAARNKPRRG